MPSELKSDTARENGAKSNGPITPEGKAKSSKNAIRHGLTAKAVVLPGESQEEFQALLDSYIHQFQPSTAVESELVQTMAVTRWRLNRMAGVETNLFQAEILRSREEMNHLFKEVEADDRLAFAFKQLANDGNSLAMLLRYEGTLTRTYDRAFKQLEQIQRSRPVPPNEPGPVSIRIHPRPSQVNPPAPQAPQPNEPSTALLGYNPPSATHHYRLDSRRTVLSV